MDRLALVRGLQRFVPVAQSGLRILCYHLIGAGTSAAVDTPRSRFVLEISALRRMARVVGVAEGLDLLRRGSDEALVAVTFDDAFRNFAEVAWPVLRELQVPATLFVPTGFVDGTITAPLAGIDLPPCDWAQLRELAASDLLTIGSHTCTHRDLRRLSNSQVASELRDSRSRLEDELGAPVDSFCYPRALWDRRVERVVRETYDWAVIGGGRPVTTRNLEPYRLWRTSVRCDSGLPVRQWLAGSVWLEEATADIVRRLR